ncbi:hypothetical protein WH91_16885 [Devosia psychrophila]|uniref:Secreted protein n=1 Tax=Devosia psychrophila TaxID=728005 RepID=A0ABR5DV66_9HYPH|nr:hypothetical protein WH91_16885 [Devosia psychrophila]
MTRYAPRRDSLPLLISVLAIVLVMLAPSHGLQSSPKSRAVIVVEHIHTTNGVTGASHLHRNSSPHDHSHAILDLQVAPSAVPLWAGLEQSGSENAGIPFDLTRAPDQPPKA